jgi:hypothetical protein
MGRLTKRNRTKYRRRAYAAGMHRVNDPQAPPVEELERMPLAELVGVRRERGRQTLDDKRAA